MDSRQARPSRRLIRWDVWGFLGPNLIGFMIFTFLPVLLSLAMSFTDWSLLPGRPVEFVGLRNYTDLFGLWPIGQPPAGLLAAWLAAVLALVGGLVSLLWVNAGARPGARLGCMLLALTGLGVTCGGLVAMREGVVIAGAIGSLMGIAAALGMDGSWRPGIGTGPALLVAVSVFGLWLLDSAMWTSYEPRDPRFWQYFYNTCYLMLAIPVSIACSLGMALLLDEQLGHARWLGRAAMAALCLVCGVATWWLVDGWGYHDLALVGAVGWLLAALGAACDVAGFRTIYYLPTFTSGVAVMILWKALYNPETGPINQIVAWFVGLIGWEVEPCLWLGSVTWAKPALMIMSVWVTMGGTTMLLYLAALSNVPRELHEAAQVDGAGRWARFRHVTWPQLAPTTFFVSIMSIIVGLQGGFEQARVMTGGGPAGSTTTLSYYIYNITFQSLDLGHGAAISWVLFAMIFLATALNWKFGKGLEVD